MKSIHILFLGIFLCSSLYLNAQQLQNDSVATLEPHLVEPSPVEWYTIEEAQQLYEKNPKPILIDVYTDWCKWCKVMMKTTFSDEEIAPYINRNFYAVRFDAESKDTIVFRDTTYVNDGKHGKAHQLAIKLLDGRLSYPTIVYFDRKGNKNVVPGYLKPREMLPLLVFFAEDIYNSTSYEQFEKYFKKTYPDDSEYSMVRSMVDWLTLEDALAKNKTQPKKIFLDIYVNWRVGSTMMMMTTYNNERIAEILNNKFYPVRLDALTKDTLHVFQDTFVNKGQGHPYHSLPIALLNGKMIFPSTLYFNEDAKLIATLQEYITPENLEPWLIYIGDNKYKETKWTDFRQGFKSNYFNARYYYDSAMKFIEKKDYRLALNELTLAINQKPDFGDAYLQRGLLQINYLKDKQNGCRDLQKAKQLGVEGVEQHIAKLCK